MVPALIALVGLIILLPGFHPVTAMPSSNPLLGMGLDRHHPEIRWRTSRSEHFIYIYPEHLTATALRVATVAEQVHDPILAGVGLDRMPSPTSVVITDQDQVVNGFAIPGHMYLWVHNNDYVAGIGGDESWIRLLFAHEFQHCAWMAAARDWTGLPGLLRTPAWFVEGIAEHATEQWSPGRSDLVLRRLFLRNRHRQLDPHDSGFAKVRYLARTYGDSTLIRMTRDRGRLGLSRWSGAFTDCTGIDLDDFEEEWRRAATAYTYSLTSQKEAVADIGSHLPPPRNQVRALRFAADSSRLAVLGRSRNGESWTLSVKELQPDGAHIEIDHGRIDGRFAFSPNGEQIVYAKRHRVEHGSLVWDLKIGDTRTGHHRWLTWNSRANHPDWAGGPTGFGPSPLRAPVVYTASEGATTELYAMDPATGERRRILEGDGLRRILDPRISPDGRLIALAMFREGRGLDIHTLDPVSGELNRLTTDGGIDRLPIWSGDGHRLYFTSTRNHLVPNLFTLDPEMGEGSVETITDAGEALAGLDLIPLAGAARGGEPGRELAALASAGCDTVRLRGVATSRRVAVTYPEIRPELSDWRWHQPTHPLPEIRWDSPPPLTPENPYRSLRHITRRGAVIIPSPRPWGLTGATLWADRAHHHSFLLGMDWGTDDVDQLTPRHGLFRWDSIALPLPGQLSFSACYRLAQGFRIYGGRLLRDRKDLVRLSWRLPLNFGEHLYARHNVGVTLERREVTLQSDPIPDGRLRERELQPPTPFHADDRLRLEYLYSKQRPRGGGRGTQGALGALVRLEWASGSAPDDNDYFRILLDGARRFDPPLPGTVMLRARGESLRGRVVPQDSPGLRSDPQLLGFNYRNVVFPLEDLLETADHFLVRGALRNRAGRSAALVNLEWQLTILPAVPISVFGITTGSLSGAAFIDHGEVSAGGGHRDSWSSLGWELRLPLGLGAHPRLQLRWGRGYLVRQDRGLTPTEREFFWSINLIDPF